MRYYGKTNTKLPTLKHFERTAEGVLFQPMATYNGTVYVVIDSDNDEGLYSWLEMTSTEIITEDHMLESMEIIKGMDQNLKGYIDTKQIVQELVEAVAILIAGE